MAVLFRRFLTDVGHASARWRECAAVPLRVSTALDRMRYLDSMAIEQERERAAEVSAQRGRDPAPPMHHGVPFCK